MTAKKILDEVVGTETLIEKLLQMFDEDKIELEDQEWPEDTIKNPKLIKSLSYTKMKNEINHREPRNITEAGTIEPHELCDTSFGWHSSSA